VTTTRTTPIVHVEAGESFFVDGLTDRIAVESTCGEWAGFREADGIILESSAGVADAEPLYIGVKYGDAFVVRARAADEGGARSTDQGGWTVNLGGGVASSSSRCLHLHFQ
jgi:hypothetical protein